MKIQQIRKLVAMESANMSVGESKRMVCPRCQAVHENSFKIDKTEDGTFYRCYRVSCSLAIGCLGGVQMPQNNQRKIFKPTKCRDDLMTISPELRDLFLNKYEVDVNSPRCSGWKMTTNEKRVYLPIRTKTGEIIGASCKDLTGQSRTKSMTYWYSDKIKLHFEIQEGSDAIVVVEDQISAKKVSEECSSVALLGTYMSPEMAEEIASVSSNVIIALDPDAASTAIKILAKYSYMFDSMRAVFLDKDPKDTPKDQLAKALFNLN